MILLPGNFISALHQAVGKAPGLDMAQLNIVGQGAKERDTITDQNRHLGDNELLDQPGS